MKSFLFALAATLLLSGMFETAGATSIIGKVFSRDGEPLPGVSVTTNLQGVGTLTDDDGVFALELGRGQLVSRLTFSSIGYFPRQLGVEQLPDIVFLEQMYYRGEDIIVTADRAVTGLTPIAFENLTADDIKRDYTVGEFPLLLDNTPNINVFTDGGASLGYSYMSIRGFNLQRIATYINGVPLNDPEDHYTYFTDLPDFASNITDIQVQRGVGYSMYGDASFGGTINVATSPFTGSRRTILSSGYGAYTADGSFVSDIYKQSLEYHSGLIDGQWAFSGRFSKQKTGGYRHNSWYEGWAYDLSMARLDPNMTTELHVYGGPIRMHLTFWGIPSDQLENNRRFNPLTYSNETDNFNQPHYQLHNKYRFNDRTTMSNTLYYIRGKGYYEQFKSARKYSDYDIESNLLATNPSSGQPFKRGDLVRQKWVQKNQVGWNGRVDIVHDKGSHAFGSSIYYFESDHWGQVVWAQNISGDLDPRHRYYQYYGKKYVATAFASEHYRLTKPLSVDMTAQIRYATHDLEQVKKGAFNGYNFDLNWLFFSPRLGFNYVFNNGVSAFANFASASRAPNDENIYDADDPDKFPQLEVLRVRPNAGDTLFEFGDLVLGNERVWELTVGARKKGRNYRIEADLFWTRYNNENVFEGGLDQLDRQITINIGQSVISGVELSASVRPRQDLEIGANFAYNHNRITDYVQPFSYTVDTTFFNTKTGLEDTIPLQETKTVDFNGKEKPLSPVILAGFIIDYNKNWLRLTWRGKVVGRQYMEPLNLDHLAIDPSFKSSLSAEFSIEDFLQLGRLTLLTRVDNLFNSKFAVSGYGGNYAFRSLGQNAQLDGWAEYYVAPERSFWGQVRLELF